MSDKCITCACFLATSGVLFVLSFTLGTHNLRPSGYQEENKAITVTFPNLNPPYSWLHTEDKNTFIRITYSSINSDGRPRTPFKWSSCILISRQCVSTASWCEQGTNLSQQNSAHQPCERNLVSITGTGGTCTERRIFCGDIFWPHFPKPFWKWNAASG